MIAVHDQHRMPGLDQMPAQNTARDPLADDENFFRFHCDIISWALMVSIFEVVGSTVKTQRADCQFP